MSYFSAARQCGSAVLCYAQLLSCVWLFATPWLYGPPGSMPLLMGILLLSPSIHMHEHGVGCHARLWGIYLTGESHWGPPALQVNSFPTELPGMPGNQLFVHIHLLPLEPACPPIPALWSSQSTELSPLHCPVASHSWAHGLNLPLVTFLDSWLWRHSSDLSKSVSVFVLNQFTVLSTVEKGNYFSTFLPVLAVNF